MKSVLISIQPHWCELIASGKKTIEVRKTRPKIDTPFKCYIYETQGTTDMPWMDEDGHMIFKGRGQVIGEFVCDKISVWHYTFVGFSSLCPYADVYEYDASREELEAVCLSQRELFDYGEEKNLYGWHISDLVIYDTPRGLSEYKTTYCDIDCKACVLPNCANGLSRPPQSWCYVEGKGGEQK